MSPYFLNVADYTKRWGFRRSIRRTRTDTEQSPRPRWATTTMGTETARIGRLPLRYRGWK